MSFGSAFARVIRRTMGIALTAPAACGVLGAQAARRGMARLPAGSYVPLYSNQPGGLQSVATFNLDQATVTRRDYLAFVRAHAEWRRAQIRPVYTDAGYLIDWRGPLDPGDSGLVALPVTSVSWFAARAYCAANGKRLPTVDEWEYAASASEVERDATRDAVFIRRLLDLYGSRTTGGAARAKHGFRNIYGISGMHESVWEWTEDFNTVLVSTDSREAGGTTRHTDFQSVCASAAIGASDPNNYPAFMRYAFRAALTGRSTAKSLGFRCAADA